MKQLDLIDSHVGRQLRSMRETRRLSQKAVAEHCGITFQQIQKYEKGTNRISASRMYQIAQLFETSPVAFFVGIEQQGNSR